MTSNRLNAPNTLGKRAHPRYRHGKNPRVQTWLRRQQ